MSAPPGQICGIVVKPCDHVFCNGPLYCGGPSQSQPPWNAQRGSATAGAAVTIPPGRWRPQQRPKVRVASCFVPLSGGSGRYARLPTPDRVVLRGSRVPTREQPSCWLIATGPYLAHTLRYGIGKPYLRAVYLVRDTGIEPVTSSVSGKRSPAELIAPGKQIWRWRRESNPCARLCRPLPHHSATPPLGLMPFAPSSG